MQAQVVAVGIQLIVRKRIDHDVRTKASFDFAAAQNHGSPADQRGSRRRSEGLEMGKFDSGDMACNSRCSLIFPELFISRRD